MIFNPEIYSSQLESKSTRVQDSTDLQYSTVQDSTDLQYSTVQDSTDIHYSTVL
jgi:hypothetical protein